MAKRGSEEFKRKIGQTVQDKFDTDPVYRARHAAGLRRYHERRRKQAMQLLREVEEARKMTTPPGPIPRASSLNQDHGASDDRGQCRI
jgi:hypothetical protein